MTASGHSSANQPKAETVLLRLFRCMDSDEQTAFLISALQLLGERCSFDSLNATGPPNELEEEQDNDDLDERLMDWPGRWPNQKHVNLHNVGDPGLWIRDELGQPISELLFDSSMNCDSEAEAIADDYLRAISDLSYELPLGCADMPEESWDANLQLAKLEFVAFFEAWRERILRTVEKQNER